MKDNIRKTAQRIAALCTAWALALGVCGTVHAEDEYVTDMLQEVIVPAGQDYVVMDVLDGVEARYRTDAYPDITGDYSCAGFVRTYYQAVYGVTVQSLEGTGPVSPADQFTRVTVPQKGDIVFYPSPPNQNNHSAVVKTFDGKRITLIEQNYKWTQSGGTYTYINRTVPYPPDASNQYEVWRYLYVSGEPGTGDNPLQPAQPTQPTQPTDPQVTPAPTPAPSQGGYIEQPPAAFSNEAIVVIGRMTWVINGQEVPVEAPAMIDESGRTIMPVRYVSLAMGLRPQDLAWRGADQTATIYSGSNVIMFKLGSDIMYINGQPRQMDCPAVLKPGNLSYLPVAYLAEALGVSFTWADYGETNKVATFYK